MKTVLVIDDNKIILESISRYLNSELKNYNVVTVENEKRAIEFMNSTMVNLIITDLAIPHIDGYNLLEYTKKNYPSIPVINITAARSFDLNTLGHKMNRVKYSDKPFNVEEMVLKVINAGRITSRFQSSF